MWYAGSLAARPSRSPGTVRISVGEHLLPFCGDRKAYVVETSDVQDFTQARLDEGTSNAEINRELAALKRMYNLGLRAEKMARKPYIPNSEKTAPNKGSLSLGSLPPYCPSF